MAFLNGRVGRMLQRTPDTTPSVASAFNQAVRRRMTPEQKLAWDRGMRHRRAGITGIPFSGTPRDPAWTLRGMAQALGDVSGLRIAEVARSIGSAFVEWWERHRAAVERGDVRCTVPPCARFRPPSWPPEESPEPTPIPPEELR